MAKIYKKSYKSKSKKSTKKKTYKYSKSKVSLPLPITPTSTVRLMKIAFAVPITSVTSGNIGFANINIASVYDPTGVLLSRQYYGTSVMFQLYRFATVLSVRYKLHAMAPSNDTNPFCIIGRIQNVSTQDTDIDSVEDFYEAPMTSTPGVKMFGNFITKNLTGNNYISGYYSAKKYYGPTSNVGTDPDYACKNDSNPTNAPHLGLYWALPPGTTTASTEIQMMMTMSAIVKWWGPRTVDND